MERRALIVGIDDYKNPEADLHGCVADATAIAAMLEKQEDGSPNYSCRLWTAPSRNPEADPITRGNLRAEWNRLFGDFTGEILFYFSGHGTLTSDGGYLVTQDYDTNDMGIAMNELLNLANSSKAREVLLILDCCHSGALGNPANLQAPHMDSQAQLREGVTILSASRPAQPAMESNGHGVFTNLLLGALDGGAADIQGRVSAASIYAYVEQALGPWDQRPLYKSHANRLSPVRFCKALVTDDLLRKIPELFGAPDSYFTADESFEKTSPKATPGNVATYQIFRKYRDAGLLETVDGDDLYFAVTQSKPLRLTPLGRKYWLLANKGRI
jgi:hypothetical protein